MRERTGAAAGHWWQRWCRTMKARWRSMGSERFAGLCLREAGSEASGVVVGWI